MKSIVTCPPTLIHWSAMFDNHMALAPYVTTSHPSYVKTLQFFAQRGDHIILDNGAAEDPEGLPLPFGELARKAIEIGAREIVLPDRFDNLYETLHLVQDSHDLVLGKWWKNSLSWCQYMAVVHAANYADLEHCVNTYKDLFLIVKLGLPKVLTKNFGSRLDIIKWLVERFYHWRFRLHLLGVWNDICEVERIAQSEYGQYVSSVDTSWPVMAGCEGVSIETSPTRKIPLYEAVCNPHPEITQRNILAYAAMCNSTV